MKLVIKKSIFIDSDKKKVWKIFSDIANWPKLNPMHKYTKWVKGDSFKEGSQFEFYTNYGWIKSKSTTIILDSHPHDSVTWRGTKKFNYWKTFLVFQEERKTNRSHKL